MIKNSETNAKIARSFNETNDCHVRAMANGLGINYRQAHAYHKKLGRKNRRGTNWKISKQFQADYGKKAYIVDKYYGDVVSCSVEHCSVPNAPKTINQLTKDERFSKGAYVVYVRGHAAAMVDGKMQDWMRENRRQRVKLIIK